MKPAEVLCRPSPSPWDEIRLLAERVAALTAGCFAASKLIVRTSQGEDRVLAVLFVSTASLLAIGELVIAADRRIRHRRSVLAQARRRIMRAQCMDGA
jgi:hypothetical protein